MQGKEGFESSVRAQERLCTPLVSQLHVGYRGNVTVINLHDGNPSLWAGASSGMLRRFLSI
jgi:hypothetical protein